MSISKPLLALALAAASFSASAAVDLTTVQITDGLFTPLAGATTVTFDSVIPAGVSYTGGYIATGSVGSEYAAPPGDNTSYLTVGTSGYQTGPATATFSGAGATYFGFYLGSPDSYNSVTFKGSDGSSTTLTGDQLVSYIVPPINADGNQGNGFYFGVKSTLGTTFTSVSFNSTSNAMETDNHAFILAVPEPETYAMLLAGLGLIGLVRRRKA